MIVSLEINGVLYSGVLFASNNTKSDTSEMSNITLSNPALQESSKNNQNNNVAVTNLNNHSNLLKNSVNINNNVNDSNHNTELNINKKNELYSFDGDYANNIIASNESKPIINDTTFPALIVPTPILSDVLKENN